jgi:UDP-N-acetylenolpyruvoylglucosamine reductase
MARALMSSAVAETVTIQAATSADKAQSLKFSIQLLNVRRRPKPWSAPSCGQVCRLPAAAISPSGWMVERQPQRATQ